MDMQSVFDAFELLDSWEERFELVADLGKELAPIEETERADANLVPGCDTRTWLTGRSVPAADGGPDVLEFHADAETPLVRGLVALLLMPYQHRTPEAILATDSEAFVQRLGLREALSVKRQGGMEAFFARLRLIASRAVAD